MGDFGLAAGEVLFAEVLVTPTGVSKGCGYVAKFLNLSFFLTFFSGVVLWNLLHKKIHNGLFVSCQNSLFLVVLCSSVKFVHCPLHSLWTPLMTSYESIGSRD